MSLTIEELVGEPTLGLNLVAGRRNAGNVVRSVQTCDLDDPLAWISAGTLLLRTNWGTDSISAGDAALVAEISKEGIAGLGIGVFGLSTSPCARLIEVADEAGLPLLTVPPRTSFQQVSTFVFGRSASDDTYRLRRTVSLHDALLTCFEDEGIDSVMETASSLLDTEILLLSEDGDIEGMWPARSRGAALAEGARKLWDAYVALSPSEGQGVLELSPRAVHFADIRCREEWSGVLFCLKSGGAGAADLDADMVTYLRGLVQLYRAGASVRRQSRGEGREVLLQQLAAGDLLPRHRLGAALAYHGISVTDALVAVLLCDRATRLSLDSGDPDMARRHGDEMRVVLSSSAEYLEGQAVPFLSGWYEGFPALVLPVASSMGESSGVDVLAVVRALKLHLESSSAPLDLSVGMSEEASAVKEMPGAFSHALQALQRAVADSESTGGVVAYPDLGIEQRVLDALPNELLDALRARVIRRLSDADPNDADQLLEALSGYMNHNGSVAKAAGALYMHRNTLRRRIARVEELLGVDFNVFADVVEVRLGLRADEVIRSRGAGRGAH